MAKLFTDIIDFKKYIANNQSLEIESIEPYINQAIEKYLVDWISKPQIDALVVAQAGTPTAAQLSLIEKLQVSLANFAMYLFVPIGQVQISDSGIHRMENDKMKTAYSNQIEKLQSTFIEEAYDALERCLVFMEDNESSYPLWMASDAYTKNKSHLINTASEFKKHYALKRGRQTLKVITPSMEDVECLYIVPCIGSGYFNYLLTLIKSKSAIPTNDLLPLTYIRKSICHFTIMQACKVGWVNFTANGVLYTEHTAASYTETQKTASAEQLSLKLKELNDIGNRYLDKAKSILDKDKTLYPNYENDTSVNPVETKTSCCSGCEKAHDRCSCSSGTGTKAFFRV